MNHTWRYSPAADHFGWYSFPLSLRVRRLSWLRWFGEISRWFTRPKMVTHPSTSGGGRESNLRPLSGKRSWCWSMCAADNCDFYPAYPGFDYFTGVHHGSAPPEFLTPPPPAAPVSSGPHHVGPPPSQAASLSDHVAPRTLTSSFSCCCCCCCWRNTATDECAKLLRQ